MLTLIITMKTMKTQVSGGKATCNAEILTSNDDADNTHYCQPGDAT